MPRKVRTNFANTTLPGVGQIDAANTSVVLTDSDFSRIPASAFAGGSPLLTDQGYQGESGDGVTIQGAAVAAQGALTSSQNATTNASDLATAITLVNALKVNYNAAQVDIAALRTKVNELQAALSGANKPLSA